MQCVGFNIAVVYTHVYMYVRSSLTSNCTFIIHSVSWMISPTIPAGWCRACNMYDAEATGWSHCTMTMLCVFAHTHMGIISSDMGRNNPAPVNCVHREWQWCGMCTRLCNTCKCFVICMCPSRLETRTKESSACASSVIANTMCELNVTVC